MTTIADGQVHRQNRQPKPFPWRARIALITHERSYEVPQVIVARQIDLFCASQLMGAKSPAAEQNGGSASVLTDRFRHSA